MTTHYYVTGTSRGIGKALTDKLLADPDTCVTGIGRTAGPSHAHYVHEYVDFGDLDAVTAFRFPKSDAGRIVLVNNAGVLAPRFLAGETAGSIRASYAVNLVAPAILTNAFLSAYGHTEAELVVCSVSSRAAAGAMPGTSLYSSAKAALESMSRVLAAEAGLTGHRLHVLCVDPGTVDTDMQGVLRDADEADFPTAERNRRFKAEGTLASPELVADRLARVLTDPSLAPDVVFTLADIPLS